MAPEECHPRLTSDLHPQAHLNTYVNPHKHTHKVNAVSKGLQSCQNLTELEDDTDCGEGKEVTMSTNAMLLGPQLESDS